MILRVVAVALLLITAAVAQTALFPDLTLAGYRPDLLLLVTIAFALRDGALAGVRVGFAAGLLTDLLAHQSAVGIATLVMVLVGYAVGVTRPYLAPSSFSAPLLFAGVGTLLATAAYGIFASLLGAAPTSWPVILTASLFVAAYNTLLAPFVVGLVARLSQRFPLEQLA